METDIIINKVADSGIITLDLADFLPTNDSLISIDFKKYLFMEMILKEKDFREQLKNENFSMCQNKFVSIFCSVDAIIPKWAYMLLMTYLKPFTNKVVVGTEKENKEKLLIQNLIQNFNPLHFTHKRVVVKGCGDSEISDNAFVLITNLLTPHVKSIMYGEACSNVPIFKNKG